jgi:hypothetical protein
MDRTLKGAEIKVYLNNKLYAVTQSVSYTIDYQEEPIFGIDSIYPQEISTTKIMISGSIAGLVLKMDGGLQGLGIRPLINQALQSPYISLRIQDRANQTDLLFVDRIKVTKESFSSQAKGLVSVSFSFVGIMPLQTLDMN